MPDLESRFRITTDQGSADNAAKAVADVGKAAKEAAQPLETVRTHFQTIRREGAEMSRLGMRMGMIGGAMLAPMVLAANNYVKNAGMAETTSRQWLQTTDQLAAAQMRVGRVIATEALPYMQKAATLAASIASFSERNPAIIRAGLLVGGTLAAGGAGLTILGQMVNTVGTAGVLLTRLGIVRNAATAAGTGAEGIAGGAAGGAGLTALGVGGSVLAGVAVGAIAVQYMASKGVKGNVGGVGYEARNLGEYGVAADYGLSKLFGASEKDAQQNALSLAQAFGLVAQKEEEAATSATKLTDQSWYQQGLTQFRSYALQRTRSEEDLWTSLSRGQSDYDRQVTIETNAYNLQRSIAVRNEGIQLNYSEQDYNRQRTINTDAFNRQQAIDEQQYYYQRSIAQRDFSISQRREQEDWQLQTQRETQDHQWNLLQAAMSGNTMAIWQENRSFNLQQSREQQDRTITQTRQQQDQSRSLSDARVNYDRQRKIAVDSYAIQQTIAADSYTIQRTRQQDQFKLQLSDQATQFAIQRQVEQTNFNIQQANAQVDFNKDKNRQDADMKSMTDALGADRAAWQAELDKYAPAFTQFLNQGIIDPLNQIRTSAGLQGLPAVVAQMTNPQGSSFNYGASSSAMTGGGLSGGGGGAGFRASGGYVGFGNYRTGEQGYEYVLDHNTTKAWERQLGGPLTQGALRGRSDSLDINFTGNVPAGVNPAVIEAAVAKQVTAMYSTVTARRAR